LAKTKLADALMPSKRADTEREEPRKSEVDGDADRSTSITSSVSKARTGKKHVGGYYDTAVSMQLTVLAAELSIERNEKVKIQELLGEAINDLFQKYNKPPIV